MVRFDQRAYQKRVNERMPKSKTIQYLLRAFWVGGLICCVGQLISDLGEMLFTLTKEQNTTLTAIVLVFLGALLTGVGVYDRIGAYAGAGSVVPITGFANSVVAPAIEFKPDEECIIKPSPKNPAFPEGFSAEPNLNKRRQCVKAIRKRQYPATKGQMDEADSSGLLHFIDYIMDEELNQHEEWDYRIRLH